MYLAASPSENDLEAYYSRYASTVREKFKELLDGRCIKLPVRRSDDKFNIRLGESSRVRNFIEKYCKEDNLRRLLIGDFNTLLDILAELKEIDDRATIPISKSKYGIKEKGRDFDVEDDIHAIFHKILVEEIYEDADNFNKEDLASIKNLSVCPYCGISKVSPYGNRNGVTLGYQIEHYLPKSKYPYFAISFYNLFPACKDCNEIQAKGVNSPLADDDRTQCLMHPYAFENDAMHFELSYDGNGDFDDRNFEICIDYHGNKHLCKGYNDVIPIENRYKAERTEAKNIWNILKSRSKDYYRYIQNMGVAFEDYLKTEDLFGFEETIDNSRNIEKYKFKTEILHKLLEYHRPTH